MTKDEVEQQNIRDHDIWRMSQMHGKDKSWGTSSTALRRLGATLVEMRG